MNLKQPPLCADLCRADGEEMHGTGGVGNVWVLLEYSKPWGKKIIAESDSSPEVKEYLGGLTKTIPGSKLLFIKQESAIREYITLFVAVCRETEPYIYELHLQSYDELLELDINKIISGEAQHGGTTIDHPLFLVCTHGKYDRCCAKYGCGVYKKMKDYVGNRAWQSSHVGGHRFAANVVCLPHGIFYGRVSESEVEHIVDDYMQQRIRLDKFRGRACYARPAQVAESFVRAQTGLTDVGALDLLEANELAEEKSWRVRFGSTRDGLIHEVQFLCVETECGRPFSCGAEEEKSLVQYQLTSYSVNAIAPQGSVIVSV
ncbi:MAG TPA: sucrase ferredoxin [Pyrinomonadaceae bacterium]|jgi:hypothetical protein|nr:sucrase ferredoxin [Pyrinomonadaceae bacterium]